MINITIKTLDSRNHFFSVPDDYTVRQLKDHIATTVDIPADSQRFIFFGRVLQNDRMLSDCDVNEKVIHLVQRPPAMNEAVDNVGQRNNATAGRFQHTTPPGGAVYLGAMAFPANFMESQGNVPHAYTNLSFSRLGVARAMIRRAQNTLATLEASNTLPLNMRQSGSTSRTNAASSASSESNHSFPDVSASSFLDSSSSSFPDVSTSRFNDAPDISNTDPIETSEMDMSIDGTMDAPIDITMDTQIDESMGVSIDESMDTPNDESMNTPADASTDAPEASANASTGPSSDRNNVTAEERTEARRRASRPGMMAALLTLMSQAQRRLWPFLRVVHRILADDPVFTEESPVSQQDAQTIFNSVSHIMHDLSHAYHALSDVMCDFSSPPPRELRCTPVFIQHSAVLHTGVLPGIRMPTVSVIRPRVPTRISTAGQGHSSTTTVSTTTASTQATLTTSGASRITTTTSTATRTSANTFTLPNTANLFENSSYISNGTQTMNSVLQPNAAEYVDGNGDVPTIVFNDNGPVIENNMGEYVISLPPEYEIRALRTIDLITSANSSETTASVTNTNPVSFAPLDTSSADDLMQNMMNFVREHASRQPIMTVRAESSLDQNAQLPSDLTVQPEPPPQENIGQMNQSRGGTISIPLCSIVSVMRVSGPTTTTSNLATTTTISSASTVRSTTTTTVTSATTVVGTSTTVSSATAGSATMSTAGSATMSTATTTTTIPTSAAQRNTAGAGSYPQRNWGSRRGYVNGTMTGGGVHSYNRTITVDPFHGTMTGGGVHSYNRTITVDPFHGTMTGGGVHPFNETMTGGGVHPFPFRNNGLNFRGRNRSYDPFLPCSSHHIQNYRQQSSVGPSSTTTTPPVNSQPTQQNQPQTEPTTESNSEAHPQPQINLSAVPGVMRNLPPSIIRFVNSLITGNEPNATATGGNINFEGLPVTFSSTTNFTTTSTTTSNSTPSVNTSATIQFPSRTAHIQVVTRSHSNDLPAGLFQSGPEEIAATVAAAVANLRTPVNVSDFASGQFTFSDSTPIDGNITVQVERNTVNNYEEEDVLEGEGEAVLEGEEVVLDGEEAVVLDGEEAVVLDGEEAVVLDGEEAVLEGEEVGGEEVGGEEVGGEEVGSEEVQSEVVEVTEEEAILEAEKEEIRIPFNKHSDANFFSFITHLSFPKELEKANPFCPFFKMVSDADLTQRETENVILNMRKFIHHHFDPYNYRESLNSEIIQALFNDHVISLRTVLDCHGILGCVDLVSTICQFNNRFIPDLINLIMSDEDGIHFVPRFSAKIRLYFCQLSAIFKACLLNDDRQHVFRIINALADHNLSEIAHVDEYMVSWMRWYLPTWMAREPCTIADLPWNLRQCIVYRLPPCYKVIIGPDTCQVDGKKQLSEEPESIEDQQALSLQEDSDGSSSFKITNGTSNNTVVSSPEVESEPVVITPEEWHHSVPSDWVPIITRDVHKLRRQGSQPPYSDAYLSGMPSKRRKLLSSVQTDHTDSVNVLSGNGVHENDDMIVDGNNETRSNESAAFSDRDFNPA